MTSPAEAATQASTLAALQARGAPQLDPVGWCHIQALARRAAAHQGATRQLLDNKLARLVAASQERVAQASSAAKAALPAGAAHTARHSPLAELLAHIARQSAAAAAGTPPGPGGAAPRAPGMVELKAVRNYRSTWSRLKVDQRMAQLQAKVPGNAGPLNTHKLLHEALTLMRDASPQYLQQFMAQVDALLWLDQAGADGEARTRR